MNIAWWLAGKACLMWTSEIESSRRIWGAKSSPIRALGSIGKPCLLIVVVLDEPISAPRNYYLFSLREG